VLPSILGKRKTFSNSDILSLHQTEKLLAGLRIDKVDIVSIPVLLLGFV
jgi:hypothetical protein